MTDLDQPPVRNMSGVLRRAAPALLVYAGVRALGIAVLAVWGAVAGKSPHQLLSARWDSLWYTRVADLGYGYEVRLPDGSVHSNLAFFPLLPWLERLGSAVSPLSYADAGLVVSAVASLCAAGGIFAIADRLYGRRAGVLAVALWAVLPVGVVQSMAYSESLFTALAAWSLYAVLTGRWVWAGLLASLAGLTRPVGAAVVAALWAVVAVQVVRERRIGARQLAGLLLAPLGAAGYVLWVGQRTGDGLFGYLDVQAGWGNGFDGGLAFARFAGGKLTAFPDALAGLGLIVGVALVIWLYVFGVRQRQPLPLLVYTGIVVALALCASGYFGSKPRLLLPAFPLLLPIAVSLARWRASRAAILLVVVAAGSAVYGAFWLHGSGPP
ncbi:glycosyltransferase family 39 protein [Streptomyces triticagri]